MESVLDQRTFRKPPFASWYKNLNSYLKRFKEALIWWLIGCRISYRADELGGKSLQNASRVEKEIGHGEEEKGGWGKYEGIKNTVWKTLWMVGSGRDRESIGRE